MNEEILQLIEKYKLVPHPEGGFYSETYRSLYDVTFNNGTQEVKRSASTAIYFLICGGNSSRLHRIKSDEVWHFYLGDSMTVVELNENEVNHCKLTVLGQNIFGNELVQYTVKANTWFGCYSNPGSKFSFVGCTVSPGFDFQDFELGSGSKLLEIFPNAREVIDKLTIGLP